MSDVNDPLKNRTLSKNTNRMNRSSPMNQKTAFPVAEHGTCFEIVRPTLSKFFQNPATARFAPYVATATCAVLLSAIPSVHGAEPVKNSKPNWGERKEISFADLQADFANPPLAYAPFMFWFWDTPLTPEAKAMAAEMAATVSAQRINPGYPNAIPMPWGAVPPDQWLAPDWFEALDGALAQAKKAGTYMGFCDEYGFPGGQAAGRVLAEHPELKAESLNWTIQDVAGGEKVVLPESFFTVAARIVKHLQPAGDVPIGQWIWHPTANGDGQKVYFRTQLEVDPSRKIQSLDINLTADDGWTLYVNGKLVAKDDYWQRISQYDLRPFVHPGTNTIAIEGRNNTSPCGLTAGIHTVYEDGTKDQKFTGADWVCSPTADEGWFTPDFDASAWENAAVLAEAGGGLWNKTFYQPDRPVEIDAESLIVIGEGNAFGWTAPAGEWRVYSFNKYHLTFSGSPVNYLDERLPEIFIKIAYEPYAKHFGDRLGETLVGAWRDNEGAYGYKLAWSGSLASRYKKDKGEDIRRMMPLLIDKDPSGQWAKARWDWFDVVSNIYADSYWQKNTDWLREHGLYCTINAWEETLMLQAAAVGDHFRVQRASSFPGVDSLDKHWLSSHTFREAQSVSEFDSRRLMCETMGVAGWDVTPTLMKQAANLTTAWGVSQFVAHINLLSRNIKALGWPPDWYTENPYFPYLHIWADFTRRANYITSHGHTAPDVLLLNPMDSVWALSGDGLWDTKVPLDLLQLNGNFGADVLRMDSVYAAAIDQLTEGRVEFLCADNHYLRQLSLKDGKLLRDGFAFGTVVMPPMFVMPLDVAARLVDFAKAGGHVYSLGVLPSASTENGANDPKLTGLMDTLRAQPHFVQCHAGLVPEIAKPNGGLHSAIAFESGEFPMVQQHRRIDGRDFFWLVNNTDTAQQAEISVRGAKGAAALWNCETGQTRPIASAATPDGSKVALTFGPQEAYYLVFDPTKTATKESPQKPVETTTAALNGPWTWRIDAATQPPVPNPVALPPDLTDGVVRGLESWNAHGLEKFSGYVDYSTEFEVTSASKPTRLDLGRVAHLAEVWVNGQNVGARLWAPYAFDITKALKPGKNTLRIRVGNLISNNMGIPSEAGLFGPVTLKK